MEFDYKKSLIAKYDAFSVEQNAQKKKFLQSEVINALNGIASLDADDFYMWGLTYYMTHEEPEVRLKKALDRK